MEYINHDISQNKSALGDKMLTNNRKPYLTVLRNIQQHINMLTFQLYICSYNIILQHFASSMT